MKILAVLLAGLLLVGCSGSNDKDEKATGGPMTTIAKAGVDEVREKGAFAPFSEVTSVRWRAPIPVSFLDSPRPLRASRQDILDGAEDFLAWTVKVPDVGGVRIAVSVAPRDPEQEIDALTERVANGLGPDEDSTVEQLGTATDLLEDDTASSSVTRQVGFEDAQGVDARGWVTIAYAEDLTLMIQVLYPAKGAEVVEHDLIPVLLADTRITP